MMISKACYKDKLTGKVVTLNSKEVVANAINLLVDEIIHPVNDSQRKKYQDILLKLKEMEDEEKQVEEAEKILNLANIYKINK